MSSALVFRIAAVCVAAAAGPVLGRLTPGLVTESRALTIGLAVSFAAMALSLHFIVGYAGRVSLGHGALAGIGGFVSGSLTARGPELPFVVGVAGAVLAGWVVGALSGIAARRLVGLWFSLASLAFGIALEQSVFRWAVVVGGFPTMEVPRPKVGSFVFSRTADYLAIAIASLAVIWFLDSNLSRSNLGRSMRAVADDHLSAASLGLNRDETITRIFVLSGATAAFAGAVLGHLLRFINAGAFSYQSVSLPLVAIAAVGGVRGRAGIAATAVAYVVFAGGFVSVDGWELIVMAIALMYVVTRRPPSRARPVFPVDPGARVASWPAGVRADAHDRGPPSLELIEVSVARAGRTIVAGMSLRVEPGSVVGMVGPNGSGKTTLLDAICGLAPVESGAVIAFDRDIGGLPVHARVRLGIGRSFDGAGGVGTLTVEENLLLAQHPSLSYGTLSSISRLPRMRREERRAVLRARAVAVDAGLEHLLSVPVRDLSFGERRWLELACVALGSPALVLLDEPTAGLGPEAPSIVEHFVAQTRPTSTVLLVEHNMALAAAVCDRIVAIDDGRIVADGGPDDRDIRGILTGRGPRGRL